MSLSPLQRIILLILILPCIYASWLALSWGIADRYAYDARQLEKTWQAKNAPTLDEAITGSEAAVRWAADNPGYRDQLARYLTQRFLIDRNPATALAAREHLLHSRGIRPASPENWAAFIDLKHHTGEADEELTDAIAKAAAYGPWQASTLQAITQAGVAHYASLTLQAQEVVHQNIQRGFVSRVPRMGLRTASLIEQSASGWTPDFTEFLTRLLVSEPWQDGGSGAYLRLALRLWPLFTPDEQNTLVLKIVDPIVTGRGKALSRQLKGSPHLHLICPRLPRTEQFRRLCAGAYKASPP